jgi:peroxiredoxin
VVDAETRDLIVGVRVIAGREVRYDMPMAWTGLNGAYELIGLPPGDNVISFQHADHATEIREVHLNTGQSTALDARLGAGGEIGGAVVDQDGQPLPGVWVTAEDWNGYETLGLRTITDEQGRFTLAHAPGGRIEFSVVKPGFGPPVREIMAAGRRDYRIALEASAAGPSAGSERDVRIAVGKSVPDLTLTPTDGTVYKLSELRGRYVFLDFWATWCGPCVREVPNVKSLHAATKGRADFVLIGVSLDQDRDAFRKFVDEKGMNWPQVVGPKSGAREAFEALEGFGIPYTCLIGPDGRMLAQHLYGESMAAEVTRHLSDSEEP